MKITLAYIPEEEQEAAATLAVLRHRLPAAKVRKSNQHPPYKHIYLAVKNLTKPHIRACDEEKT